MPGRPGKNRRKDSDEPLKRKFGKATRKGRKMKCSVCKTFGHNKKGCPTLKNAAAGTSAATSNVAAGTSVASAATAGSQSSVNAGPNAGCTPSAGSSACPSAGCTPSAGLISAQQSTSSAGGQKRKTSTTLRGGATLAYKKPRPKKAKTAGYGLLFGSGGTVTAR
ncbi:hypothetical protein MTR67_021590, partial [Solanum verrucosum]